MDVHTILYYGDRTLMKTIEGLTEAQMSVGGVCGVWSVADILAHLDTSEQTLGEVLSSFVTPGSPMPLMTEAREQGRQFNDIQVAKYEALTPNQILESYESHFQRTAELAKSLPAELWAQAGTIPWYGEEYSLDDLVVYSSYGHKREHSAQIAVYKDTLNLAKSD